MIPTFSNFQDAHNYISSKPGISLQELGEILNQFAQNAHNDPAIANGDVLLLYSGDMPHPLKPGERIPAWQVVDNLFSNSDGYYINSAQTEIAQLIGDYKDPENPFGAAVLDAVGGNRDQAAALYNGTMENGIRQPNGYWDIASTALVEGSGSKPIALIGQSLASDSVFLSAELPQFLSGADPNRTLMGIPQSEWRTANDNAAQNARNAA